MDDEKVIELLNGRLQALERRVTWCLVFLAAIAGAVGLPVVLP